jgi:hypothetical protein
MRIKRNEKIEPRGIKKFTIKPKVAKITSPKIPKIAILISFGIINFKSNLSNLENRRRGLPKPNKETIHTK